MSHDSFLPAAVYSPDTARLICSLLSDTTARVKGFGFASSFNTPFPSLFKTGTANQHQSLIALAATSEYTVGVWLGNFSGDTVIGKTGSSIPAYIARQLLIMLHEAPDEHGQTAAAQPFQEPVHWHKQPVCALSGMCAGAYCPNTVMEYMPDTSNTRPVCPYCTIYRLHESTAAFTGSSTNCLLFYRITE